MVVKVTYIAHSGFAAELSDRILLFDYYRGKLPEWPVDKPVYVFASHKHRDHFSLSIFSLAEKYRTVKYFFSNDISLSENYLQKNGIDPGVHKLIRTLKADEIWTGREEKMRIRTLKSTDEGVAFIVETESLRIYHAGDLNWWHWDGEAEPLNRDMERDYKRAVDSVRDMHFDLAFLPLDPRLEEAYALGMNYFLENTVCDRIFPMHMWKEYSYIDRYLETECGRRQKGKIAEIKAPGQEFIWNI